MDKISKYIDRLVKRVINKTNDAMIDWKNSSHIIALEEIMISDGIGFYHINELVLSLQEKDKSDNKAEDTEADSPATREAHRLGYSYLSGGVWLDKEDGKVVAKSSKDGKTLEDWSDEEQKKPGEQKKKTISKIEPRTDDVGNRTDPASIEANKDEISDEKRNGKQKGVKQGNPMDKGAWKEGLLLSDEDWKTKMGKRREGQPFNIDTDKYKSNVRNQYREALVRMMATKAKGQEGGRIKDFTGEKAGQGQLFSQAGEIMAMIATAWVGPFPGTEDDEDSWVNFVKEMKGYLDETFTDGKGGVITKEWIDSATISAISIRDMAEARYGKGTKIIAGGWDKLMDYNLLGATNKKVNGGFSTDVYFKVQGPDDVQHLFEVSLKKDENTFILNSTIRKQFGTGHGTTKRFGEYRQSTFHMLDDAMSGDDPILTEDDFDTPEEKELFKDLQVNVKKLKKDTNDRDIAFADGRKLFIKIQEKAKAGNPRAIEWLNKDNKSYEATRVDIMNMMNDPENKEGTKKMVKHQLALTSIANGEEVLSFGQTDENGTPIHVNEHTLEEIFGKDALQNMEDHIVTAWDESKDPHEPILVYKVEGQEKPIVVATLNTRQKPRGSGGFLFDVKFAKSFLKLVVKANKDIKARKDAGNDGDINESKLMVNWDPNSQKKYKHS